MTDPAIEAAHRAVDTMGFTGRGLVIAAAREALNSIRDKHYAVQ